jgi:hypothetical protein
MNGGVSHISCTTEIVLCLYECRLGCCCREFERSIAAGRRGAAPALEKVRAAEAAAEAADEQLQAAREAAAQADEDVKAASAAVRCAHACSACLRACARCCYRRCRRPVSDMQPMPAGSCRCKPEGAALEHGTYAWSTLRLGWSSAMPWMAGFSQFDLPHCVSAA